MEMSIESAYRRSIETVMDWIESEVNMSKTQVFFRSYAPVHFRFLSFSIYQLLLVFFILLNPLNPSVYNYFSILFKFCKRIALTINIAM